VFDFFDVRGDEKIKREERKGTNREIKRREEG